MKPDRMLGLVALRRAWPSRDDDDRPAALGMSVDCDGMIRRGPLTVEDVITYASFQLMGPDELERLWGEAA